MLIDPEILGKLRTEASTIWNSTVLRSKLVVYAIIPAFFFGVLISNDISFKYLPGLSLWVVALDSIVRLNLQEKAHRKLIALVESYQPIFSTE